MYFVETCMLTYLQNAGPIVPTILRFINSALTPRAPQRTVGSHINVVTVIRVNGNHTDVLTRRQSNIVPRFSTVAAHIYAIAVGYRTLVVVFTRSDPNDIRISWVYGNTPSAVASFTVENGLEGRAIIGSLPYPARG